MKVKDEHTKGDARIVLSYVVTLLVGKEHVGGKTTLGRIGICVILVGHGRE